MRVMNRTRRDCTAFAIRQFETIARVFNKDHFQAHIRAHPYRSGHAHIGGDAEHHKCIRTQATKAQIEIGADEGGVHAFCDKRL